MTNSKESRRARNTELRKEKRKNPEVVQREKESRKRNKNSVSTDEQRRIWREAKQRQKERRTQEIQQEQNSSTSAVISEGETSGTNVNNSTPDDGLNVLLALPVNAAIDVTLVRQIAERVNAQLNSTQQNFEDSSVRDTSVLETSTEIPNSNETTVVPPTNVEATENLPAEAPIEIPTEMLNPVLIKYEADIRKGPTVVCGCCGGLFFPHQTRRITKRLLEDKNAEPAFIGDIFNIHPELESDTFCTGCSVDIKKLQKPRLCMTNGFKFPELPEELTRLNRVEERLVSARHVFQSITKAGGVFGQYRTKGAVVNVPVTVDTTVSILPRSIDDTNIVEVQLTRRLAHQHNYMQGVVNPRNVWLAAHYLKTTPLFRKHNLSISDSWLDDQLAVEQLDLVESILEEGLGSNNERGNDVEMGGEIRDEVPEQVPEQVQVQVQVQEQEQEDMNPGGQETIFAGSDGLRIAPAEGSRPLSLLFDDDAEALAFPTIFGGVSMKPVHKNKPVSYAALVKSFARNFDRRAVKRTDFLLFMDRKRQLLSLTSNVTTMMRMSRAKLNSPLSASNILDNDGLNKILGKDEAFQVLGKIRSSPAYWKKEKSDVMAMIRQLGVPTLFVTLSAAETKWPELLVILKKVVDNEDITEEQADLLSYNEKARLIQADPITCARYFDARVRHLKSTWKPPHGPFGSYKVKEYYFRIEYQQRGSAHLHMLIWLEDAPLFQADEDHASIIAFIDSIISCRIVPEEEDKKLHDLILSRQVHTHARTCFKKATRKNPKKCRFNYPFFPMDETCILEPFTSEVLDNTALMKAYSKNAESIRLYLDTHGKDLHNTSTMTFNDFIRIFHLTKQDYINAIRSTLKSTKIFIKRAVSEVIINNYNPLLLKMHRANLDIQYVLDGYGCCMYVVDYINKSDKGMSDLLCQVLQESASSNSSTRRILQDLSSAFHNLSEVSAQEAAYNLLQLRMCEASSKTVFISSSPPEKRSRMLKSKDKLEKLDRSSRDIYEPGNVEHYAARPESLSGLTFAEFVAHFDYSKKKSRNTVQDNDDEEVVENEDIAEADEASEGVENVGGVDNPEQNTPPDKYIALEGNIGFVKQRKKPKIIKYHRNSIDQDPDAYFYHLVMLYFPWKNQHDDLDERDVAEIFEEHKDFILANRAEFNAFDDASLDEFMRMAEQDRGSYSDDEDDNEDNEEGAGSTGRNRPGSNEDDFRQYSLPGENSTNIAVEMDGETGDIEDGVEVETGSATFERYIRPDKLSDSEYQQILSVLNNEQRDALTHVMNHVRHVSQADDRINLFVTGGAGCGKSHLIKALYQSLIRFYDINRDRDLSSPSVLLCAPTGKAAYNISGQTLHSAFHLPLNQSELNELSADIAHTMTVALAELKVVIIDEISMVAAHTFLFIDKRLRDIFDPEKPFGGRHIIIFGDFNQLPPVHGSAIFSPSDTDLCKKFRVESLWHRFKVHYLTEIMRQRDDALFAVALNNMARGRMTNADKDLIKSRTFNVLPADVTSNNNEKLVRLFWTNADVERCNATILSSMTTQRSESRCYDTIVGNGGSRLARQSLRYYIENSTLPANKTMGLPKILQLQIDARYMVTSNLDTSDGLINGTTGVLKHIDFGVRNGSDSNPVQLTKPLKLWLLLDDERSGRKKRAAERLCNTEDSIYREWTPIEPVRLKIHQRTNGPLSVRREQFPLVVAEAITIHKSQGSTYNKVALEVNGDKQLSRALKYVACSRATSASGLYIISDNFKPTTAPKATAPIAIEINRHQSVIFTPIFKSLRDNTSSLQLMFHNVQSLSAHKDQLINDQVYMNSSLLLFAETWSIPSQELSINGFTEVVRTDVEGNSPRPYGTACYLNNSVFTVEIQNTFSRNYTDNNGHHISISSFTISNILIASIYISPRFSQPRRLEVLTEILSIDCEKKIICGDFNTDFKQTSPTNPIINLFSQNGLQSVLPSSITSTTNSGTFIDNIFSNIQPVEAGRYISFTSYHDPLFLRFSI